MSEAFNNKPNLKQFEAEGYIELLTFNEFVAGLLEALSRSDFTTSPEIDEITVLALYVLVILSRAVGQRV